MSQGRSLYREIFKNFINSLKPRKVWGEFKGKDYLGTEYYEGSGAQGSRRPTRWFVTVDNNFEKEIPPEWEAWLRYRRKEPPTEEEIQYNLLKMNKTLENVAKLEASRVVKKDENESKTQKPAFPVYKEYNLPPDDKP